MIKKFNEKFLADKTRIDADIEQLKNEQDVLKISFTVNEKKLLEKIKAEVRQDMREAVKVTGFCPICRKNSNWEKNITSLQKGRKK